MSDQHNQTPISSQSLDMLSFQLKTLHNDVTDMRRAVNEMAKAITQLALIEERQAQTSRVLERMTSSIETVSGRVHVLEQKAPTNARAADWVDRAVVAIVTAGFFFGLSKLGVVP